MGNRLQQLLFSKEGSSVAEQIPAAVAVPKGISLWPTQIEHVRLTHASFNKGANRVLSVGPTAAGKRYLACYWADILACKGKRVLVVTDRLTLIDQMKAEMRRFGIEYGVIQGNTPTNYQAQVQVASIQTLRSRGYDCWCKPNLIIIDEAHKEPAAYTKLFEQYPDSKVIGLTATPVGPSGSSMIHDGLYDSLVIGTRNSDLLEQKRVLPVTVKCPSEPNMEGVKVTKHEYVKDDLTKAIERCTAWGDIFKEWSKFSDRPTIVFVPKLAYGEWLVDRFADMGHDFRVIDYRTSKEDREDLFRKFEKGEIKGLISYDVLREGFDCRASCGIDLQPSQQLRSFIQKCGRVRRQREEFDDAVWIDMAGNVYRHNFHPDEDIPWHDVQGTDTTADIVSKYRESKPALVLCPSCNTARKPSRKCPSCGVTKEDPKFLRKIRMGDGKLVTVDPTNVRKKRKESEDQKAWDGCRYRAMYCGRPMRFAKILFYQEKDRWPNEGLKNMPTRGSDDWDKRPDELYPWMRKRRKRSA